MLPAGLEIENVRLADSGQLGDLSWLGTLSAVNHVEYRDDRFVAALDLKPDQPAFRLVYLVRAVTPGDYAMPGAYVEDMYSPNLFARGAAGGWWSGRSRENRGSWRAGNPSRSVPLVRHHSPIRKEMPWLPAWTSASVTAPSVTSSA